MIIKGNFSFNKSPKCNDGDVFDDFNLTQFVPHTKVCEGKKGLTFQNGNIVNCDLPDDSVNKCKVQHISFCSHLHPEWIPFGLPVCANDCVHATNKKEYEEDSKVIYSQFEYEDKVE